MTDLFEETSGYVRRERVNKWPNPLTDMMIMMMINSQYNTESKFRQFESE